MLTLVPWEALQSQEYLEKEGRRGKEMALGETASASARPIMQGLWTVDISGHFLALLGWKDG